MTDESDLLLRLVNAVVGSLPDKMSAGVRLVAIAHNHVFHSCSLAHDRAKIVSPVADGLTLKPCLYSSKTLCKIEHLLVTFNKRDKDIGKYSQSSLFHPVNDIVCLIISINPRSQRKVQRPL